MKDVEVTFSTDHPGICPSKDRIRSLAVRVLDLECRDFERVGIVVSDHALVTHLHATYLHRDDPTDVLSFRYSEEHDPIEGEVYVDVQTAAERSAEFDATPAEEVLRYVVHGLLHLAGYDDASEEQRLAMRRLEDRYLAQDDGVD